MDPPVHDIEFERLGTMRKVVRTLVVNPLANYFPAGVMRGMLRFAKSELASANWSDPGGWRSMVISYNGRCRQIADKILVKGGAMPMALRNRKRLGAKLLAGLIDETDNSPVHVLCLGAGPGQIIMDAMTQAKRESVATLVDLNSDAFEFGRRRAEELRLAERVHFVQCDVRDVGEFLERPPDIVKMLGICEYLEDEQIVSIASAAADVMPAGAPIVFNSLSKAHGNDRFFRRVFGLHMIHRQPEELQSLMDRAGFMDFTATSEPLGIYHVIVGRRKPRLAKR